MTASKSGAGEDQRRLLSEIADRATDLRIRAAELNCGFLAYLLAQAEDEAREQAAKRR